jgi:diadenosine tetraphosphatase ApaH/serine/threonine PP2A family protein phosphatase
LRYAIISDIHSNLQALTAVTEAIRRVEVDQILCLGDIVGYGARPAECIGIVREICQAVLLGNHDAAATGRTSPDYFNTLARSAIEWTREVLGAEEIDYLRSLPLTFEADGFLATHATYSSPEKWDYIFSTVDAAQEFSSMGGPLLLYGHTHYPIIFTLDGFQIGHRRVTGVVLRSDRRHIVNVGSVGQPRDGDSSACFLTLDSASLRVEYHRVPYDIEGAQRDILDAGIPKELALRLSIGR